MAYEPENLINLDTYPIHQAGPKRDQLVKTVQTQLAEDGCAVLKSFLTPDGIRLLRDEADSVAPFAHSSFGKTNAYFTADDPSLPADHLAAVFLTAQTHLFLLIISKSLEPCEAFMIFRHSTLLSKHVFTSMTFIAMPTRLPMSLLMWPMQAMDSHGILTRIISPLPLPFKRQMKGVCSNMPLISGKMARILKR